MYSSISWRILQTVLIILLSRDQWLALSVRVRAAGSYCGSPLPLELGPNFQLRYQSLCSSRKLLAKYPHLNNLCFAPDNNLNRDNLRALQIVHASVHQALKSCRMYLKHRRFNCVFKRHFLSTGTKQSALVWALATAKAVHNVVRACHQGVLDNCKCDRWQKFKKYSGQRSNEIVNINCKNNFRNIMRYVRLYFNDHKSNRKLMNFTQIINKHNRRVGMFRIRRMSRRHCTCHGKSVSCATKVCWKKVENYDIVENSLINSLSTAQHVEEGQSRGQIKLYMKKQRHSWVYRTRQRERQQRTANSRNRRRGRRHPNSPSRRELIFRQISPDFCSSNPRMGLPSNQGRVCNATGIGEDGCGYVCCRKVFKRYSENIQIKNGCRFDRKTFKLMCDVVNVTVVRGQCLGFNDPWTKI